MAELFHLEVDPGIEWILFRPSAGPLDEIDGCRVVGIGAHKAMIDFFLEHIKPETLNQRIRLKVFVDNGTRRSVRDPVKTFDTTIGGAFDWMHQNAEYFGF